MISHYKFYVEIKNKIFIVSRHGEDIGGGGGT